MTEFQVFQFEDRYMNENKNSFDILDFAAEVIVN